MVRLSPQGPDRRMFMNFGLVCIVVILLCVCVVLRPCRIYLILLWQNIACFGESAIKHPSTN